MLRRLTARLAVKNTQITTQQAQMLEFPISICSSSRTLSDNIPYDHYLSFMTCACNVLAFILPSSLTQVIQCLSQRQSSKVR